jgi:predicted RNA-binding Zn-ribbon protein involved in translation (DUF1610 family)
MVGSRKTLKKIKTQKKFDDCSVCNINLSKWGEGGNGFMCPPCVELKRRQDTELRRHIQKVTGEILALVVPASDDEMPYVINLKDTSIEDKVGGTSCIMYRDPEAFKEPDPLYDAYMNDTALNDGLPYNDYARRLAGRLGIFKPDMEWAGDIVFTGPNQTGLLASEIRRFKEILN